MGIAAYNRGSRLLREQLEREQKERARLRPPPLEPLCWEDQRASLVARIRELERDRVRAVRCIRVLELSRTLERQAAAEREEQRRGQVRQLGGLVELMTARWRFVSGLVRACLTPRQVHAYLVDNRD